MNDQLPYVTPTLTRQPGEFLYVFDLNEERGYSVGVRLNDAAINQRNDLRCQFRAYWWEEGKEAAKKHVHFCHASLSLSQDQQSVERACVGKAEKLIDWSKVINYVATKTFDLLTEGGAPVEALKRRASGPDEERYLIEGVMPRGEATTLFAAGGSLKSLNAMAMTLAIASGQRVGPFKPLDKLACLYVDYETTKFEQEQRLTKLADGTGIALPEDMIHHIPLNIPFVKQQAYLSRVIAERKIGLIVIDSIAPAVGGPMEVHEYVNDFFNALLGMAQNTGVTALVISHIAKPPRNARPGGPPPTPYGSVFVENRSRAVWWVNNTMTEPAAVGKPNIVVLQLTKANNMPKGKQLAVGYTWQPDGSIQVASRDVNRDEELAEFRSSSVRVEQLLAKGPKTYREIATEAGISIGAARMAISRLTDRGQVISVNDAEAGGRGQEARWALGVRGEARPEEHIVAVPRTEKEPKIEQAANDLFI